MSSVLLNIDVNIMQSKTHTPCFFCFEVMKWTIFKRVGGDLFAETVGVEVKNNNNILFLIVAAKHQHKTTIVKT